MDPEGVLLSDVLPGDPVKGALKTTFDLEVSRINGEHPALLHDTLVDPARELELHHGLLAFNLDVAPFVDPRERAFVAPEPAAPQRTDVGADIGVLEAVQGGLELVVRASAGTAGGVVGAPNGTQQLVRTEAQHAACGCATALALEQLARSPDQHVRVPDCGHAVLGVRGDLDPHTPVGALVVDRLHPFALSEREEGPLHRLPLIAEREVGDVVRQQAKLQFLAELAHGRRTRIPVYTYISAPVSTYTLASDDGTPPLLDEQEVEGLLEQRLDARVLLGREDAE